MSDGLETTMEGGKVSIGTSWPTDAASPGVSPCTAWRAPASIRRAASRAHGPVQHKSASTTRATVPNRGDSHIARAPTPHRCDSPNPGMSCAVTTPRRAPAISSCTRLYDPRLAPKPW